jgi:hypothetical protein
MDGFGGVGKIYYQTLSQYARDTGFVGDKMPMFMAMLRAMDSEYLTYVAEERSKAKTNTKED